MAVGFTCVFVSALEARRLSGETLYVDGGVNSLARAAMAMRAAADERGPCHLACGIVRFADRGWNALRPWMQWVGATTEGSTVNRLFEDEPAATAACGRQAIRSGTWARRSATVALALVLAPSAHASFLPPEMMDSAAMGLAWFIIVAVPIGAIVLFWMVHVLPEKIAHRRHHPQTDAIKMLCLLSLVFGGLLWPLAWLWAYVKPVGYRMAYGTEKHDDYFLHEGRKALAGQLDQAELDHLREELDVMADRGSLSAQLKKLRGELTSAKPAAPPTESTARAGSA